MPKKYDNQNAASKGQKTVGKPSMQAILGKAKRYIQLREEETAIKAQKTELGNELKILAQNEGAVDDNGSHVIRFPSGYTVANRAKKSQVVDHAKANEIFTKLGILERCTKRVVDESALELAFQEGLITLDQIESFTSEKVSYSVDVRGPK